MNKFFRYSGAKDKFTSLININIKTDKKIYCEPFIGSGAVLFNLNKSFDKYIINDIDRNIIRIYKSFKNISYSYYKEVIDSVFKEFGKFTYNRRYSDQENSEKENRTIITLEIGLIQIIGEPKQKLKVFIYIFLQIVVLILC